MKFKKILKVFDSGNTCVCGLRGRGKDLLMANVVLRRKHKGKHLPYVSNVDYGGDFSPLELEKLDCGKNTYNDFINDTVKKYEFPYPDRTDIYISDAGVYFPSQFCNELNKKYPYFSTFMALSRHLGDANVHFNVQNLNRCWDKIREQSDQYIMCMGTCYIPFINIVIQRVRLYDKYQSCVDRVPPFRINIPIIGSGKTRYEVRMRKQEFACAYGEIKSGILIYRNRSKYDTRIFKEKLKNGTTK